MTLSWNQIRANASRFADAWTDARYEKGETQSFYNDFFEVFGHRRRNVAIYEQKVRQLNDKTGFIDLFWPGTLVVEQKSAGRNLAKAKQQAMDYILALREYERPRYLLLSDFQNFELYDFEEGTEHGFILETLKDNIKLFDFVAGRPQQKYRDQDPVNIIASELMGNLHNMLRDDGYTGHDLELFLVRLMFCLFADDTGIFDRDLFIRYVEDRTAPDGSDTGSKLVELFHILDTPENRRQKSLDEDLTQFPYVNGQLFRARIDPPQFTQALRQALLQCCYFNWTKVSPALFGSLFQTVMLPKEQRAKGAHYTSEKNILKTIAPLFLDDLHGEFLRIKADRSSQRDSRLRKFHDKLAALTFFDPACGCGNFLILAYRELRDLELELLDALYPRAAAGTTMAGTRQGFTNVRELSRIDVDQFYGIEIEEFPARIAETAMWLVDHQMNMKLSEVFGEAFARLPLQKAPHIHHANALRADWKTVIAPEQCSFILGNPPFIGSKFMNAQQRDEIVALFPGKGGGILDYVAGWYLQAAEYIKHTKVKVAFVSTNSITQGEQVGVLWEYLSNQRGMQIHFAHRTFKWTIDAQRAEGMRIAAVYVVIIGFAADAADRKLIYDYETVTSVPHRLEAAHINGYLIDAPNVFVGSRHRPLCDAPEMSIGNKPIDDGNYLFTPEARKDFLKQEPEARKYFRRWLGADEFINGYERWCLYLADCPPHELRRMPEVMKRVEAVRRFRLKSKSESTRKIAATPIKFHVTNVPDARFLAIPEVSSENRGYIPIGFLPGSTLASNLIKIVPDAKHYHFGVLTSAMHMAWVRQVCGRLEGRYRYSKDIVYNNFPWPNPNAKRQAPIAEKAQAVLEARKLFPQSTLADLYDPDAMPAPLRRAHQALDKAVDQAYRAEPFKNELERVQFLFKRYQELAEPLTAIMTRKPKRGGRKA